MINPSRFLTHSLRISPYGSSITRILAAAISAVDPYQSVKDHLSIDRNILYVDQQKYPLDEINRILVIAFGKASLPMANATNEILGQRINSGYIISKAQVQQTHRNNQKFLICQAEHPIPNQNSVDCAKAAVNYLNNLSADDLVIFLISGGGSSLLSLPADGIQLEDIQNITKSLLRCGATINDMNCVRKHLSQVKGGGLAKLAAPANVISLILSDVVDDSLGVIASGPTAPDPTTFLDAKEILQKYELIGETPQRIFDRFDQGSHGLLDETPKQNDPLFYKVKNFIIGNNYKASIAAKKQAELEGFNTLLLSTHFQGEARTLGKFFVAIAKQLVSSEYPTNRPACIIGGGETTVSLRGNGLGGRNQELALSTVKDLDGLGDLIIVTLATDGEDGLTDAAGAVVTGDTLKRSMAEGRCPQKYLSENDSYHFFEPLGDLLKPGRTNTNVCDLSFIFSF